jgi:hypothetical protein
MGGGPTMRGGMRVEGALGGSPGMTPDLDGHRREKVAHQLQVRGPLILNTTRSPVMRKDRHRDGPFWNTRGSEPHLLRSIPVACVVIAIGPAVIGPFLLRARITMSPSQLPILPSSPDLPVSLTPMLNEVMNSIFSSFGPPSASGASARRFRLLAAPTHTYHITKVGLIFNFSGTPHQPPMLQGIPVVVVGRARAPVVHPAERPDGGEKSPRPTKSEKVRQKPAPITWNGCRAPPTPGAREERSPGPLGLPNGVHDQPPA